MSSRFVLLLCIVTLAQVALACDTLVPENCLLPYPSNFYTKPDASTRTGLRVVYPDSVAPRDRLGRGFDMGVWSRMDGFSPGAVAMAFFANVSLLTSRTPTWWDLGQSMATDCPTVLLDAETGTRLPHFVELDHTSGDATGKQAFMLWPIQQLEYGRRYVVAMRNLVDSTGNVIRASNSFAALRDGVPSADPSIEARRELYENIFELLAEANVPRGTLQLAWDFTTASLYGTTNYLVHARDDTMSTMPAGGPEYRVTNVRDDVNQYLARIVDGEMLVPHYLTDNAKPNSQLVLDADGVPVRQGEVWVPFTVFVPHSCADGTLAPCSILNYGHGLLGSRNQAGSDTQSIVSSRYGHVIFAVDMWGMSSEDSDFITETLATNITNMIIVPDRSIQGLLNHLVVVKLAMGRFANDPTMTFNGRSVVDTGRVFYWGISQGGILGTVVMAASQDITVGHLGVPGGPYPLLLARSVDFDPFFGVIKARYTDAIDRIVLISLMGHLWDRAEPSGFAAALASSPLPGVPQNKRVFLDYAHGDAQVSYLGAYWLARTVGAKVFRGNVVCGNESSPIYGITETASPLTTGSLMVGYDFGIACGPIVNLPPPKETDTHGMPCVDDRNRVMVAEFFAQGTVHDVCNGAGCRPVVR